MTARWNKNNDYRLQAWNWKNKNINCDGRGQVCSPAPSTCSQCSSQCLPFSFSLSLYLLYLFFPGRFPLSPASLTTAPATTAPSASRYARLLTITASGTPPSLLPFESQGLDWAAVKWIATFLATTRNTRTLMARESIVAALEIIVTMIANSVISWSQNSSIVFLHWMNGHLSRVS